MAMNASEIIRWLQTFPPETVIAINDGGLTLIDVEGDAYLEVGGVREGETE